MQGCRLDISILHWSLGKTAGSPVYGRSLLFQYQSLYPLMTWCVEETTSLRTNNNDDSVISSNLNLQVAGSVSAAKKKVH